MTHSVSVGVTGADMTTRAAFRRLLPVLLAVVFAVPSVSAAQSGVRESLDGASILVNKDVNDERWAIAFDRATGTVTGNVFFVGGRAPAYIWCAPWGDVGVIEPGAPDLELSCLGNDPCEAAPCGDATWSFLADVTLPVSFFLPGPAAPTPSPVASPTPTPGVLPSPVPTSTEDGSGGVPATPDALFAYLQSRAYQSFAAESGVHPTNAPHMTSVRTFLNRSLEASLARDASSHPVGAAAVKELYGADGMLSGWAVVVKVAPSDGSDGDAWYWYEVFNIETGAPRIEGVGNSVCTGCHASGVDFIRVPFPLQ